MEIRLESGWSHKDDKPMNTLDAKGLCLNCDDAQSCKFPGFGGEVLFCEEHSSNFDNKDRDGAFRGNAGDAPGHGVNHLIPGWDS